MAAILHDTVEDTDTSIEEIEKLFGPKVARIVYEVTDDSALPWQDRKAQQIVNAKKCSFEAKLVKMADKIYNLRDIARAYPVGWTEIRVQRYYDWAKQVCSGLSGTNSHLENKLNDIFTDRSRYVEVEKICVDTRGHECCPDYADFAVTVSTDMDLLGSGQESVRGLSNNDQEFQDPST
jgi:hypothetical protein